MPQNIVDYLIIGQGLAGSVLADKLIQRGSEVLVLDNANIYSSTLQAAGLVHPITGRRFVKSWMIDQLLDAAVPYYQQLEQRLNLSLLHHMQVWRIFKSAGEENDWLARSARRGWTPYMQHLPDRKLAFIKSDHLGVGIVDKSFILDTQLFLSAIRSEFIALKAYRQESFVYQKLHQNHGSWIYNTISCKHIIFAEGYKAIHNPFFSYLPFLPAKGELLIIKCAELPQDKIIKADLMWIPLGEQRFWVGASYQWDYAYDLPTKKKYLELKNRLDRVLAVPYTILVHKSGIRPTVKDRRPLLGNHPHHPSMYIFNGFGTKGTSLIPFFAQQMCDYLLDDQPLLRDVSVDRFKENFY